MFLICKQKHRPSPTTPRRIIHRQDERRKEKMVSSATLSRPPVHDHFPRHVRQRNNVRSAWRSERRDSWENRRMAEKTHASDHWYLYLIECRSGAYYAGITNDLEARYQAHASGKGARYTRANPPVRLLGYAPFPDRSSASQAEWSIKRIPREGKIAFLLESGGTLNQLEGEQHY